MVERNNKITKLSDNVLKEERKILAEFFGCMYYRVEAVFDEKKGYHFYYKSVDGRLFPIGQKLWISDRYLETEPYEIVLDEIRKKVMEDRELLEQKRIESAARREEKKEKKRKVKFALQVGQIIGTRLAPIGLAALIAIGVINLALNNNGGSVPDTDPIAITTQAPVRNLNTISSANDLLLITWANATMSELSDEAARSQWDQVRSQVEDLRTYGFLPVAQNYYNYLDAVDSNMPLEFTQDMIANYNKEFRNAAYSFDETLKEGVFSRYSFANSIYAQAILVDANGNVITNASGSKEAVDVNGNLVTFDDSFTVYVVKPANYEGDTFTYGGLEFVSLDNLEKTDGYTK